MKYTSRMRMGMTSDALKFFHGMRVRSNTCSSCPIHLYLLLGSIMAVIRVN
jgi:hypothetical protein